MSVVARPIPFATFATLVAGFVDAVGYAHLGGLFLSFMSGNSTRFGLRIAQGQWSVTLVTEAAGGLLAALTGLAVAFHGHLVRPIAPQDGA